MNLDQITTKCWILALFERDDGERLLLGDGWFDFKDSLQHFQPNTFANDVIELQGSDGQMLAGQVRRGAPQSFDGYIGDPITNRQTIEQHRREFLMFFRKRHHYKVVYIFPDGTAIQRKQGYITDAPSVPEIRQRFPEYHVALNFEDVNYYEYAENAQGEEIFSNIRNINISTAATGGLVWDNLGAVSDQMGWKDIATATGQMLTMTNPESIKAPIASFEMTGNATQSGTPTPSAPVPIRTTTGRQTITVIGKNLYDPNSTVFSIPANVSVEVDGDSVTVTSLTTTTSNDLFWRTPIPDSMLEDGKTYTASSVLGSGAYRSLKLQLRNHDGTYAGLSNGYTITYDSNYTLFVVESPFAPTTATQITAGTTCTISNIQVEEGSTATAYEPYHEQSYEINLGSIELCKIGTYQDRVYKENGKWWLHKETGKVVLTGNETIGKGGTTQNQYFYANVLSNYVKPSGNDQLVPHFSNRFVSKTPNQLSGGSVVGSAIRTDNAVGFAFGVNSEINTIDKCKTWLASNPTTLYYVLATPTTTEITDDEILEGLNSAAGLKLFPGQNNIMDQTPNAQPTMTVQYYTALGAGGGLVWESGEAGGATIIEASGLDSAFPLWTVPGPSTNPTLTNITTGQSITWQGTVPAGQTLEIDMDKQTATLAGANVYAFVSGDWIRIDPGSNRMTYVGTGATQASTLSWNNIVG